MTLNGGNSPLAHNYIFITNAACTQYCQMYYDRPSSKSYLQSDAGGYNSSAAWGPGRADPL
jgi:hypothetical protein